MKHPNQVKFTHRKPIAIQSTITLHELVEQLTVNKLPAAIHRQNIIMNNVHPALEIFADEQQVAMVLGNLLNTIISYTSNSCIRISAKTFGNVTILHLREHSRLNNPQFISSLSDIQEMAEEIGGSVNVTSYRNEMTTVAMSFMNIPVKNHQVLSMAA
ncbi:MAG: hypothetical protein WDN26_04925 [Chitinophagaceae bacterium]